jgi:hypothetical protein
MTTYMHVDFVAGNLDSPGTWSALGALLVNLSPILKLGTRILHGLLSFGGLINNRENREVPLKEMLLFAP